MKMSLSLLLASLLVFQIASSSEVENIDENMAKMGFDRFYTELRKYKNNDEVKIAIFDYGFDGYENEMGYTIPQNTEFKQRPGDTNIRSPQYKNTHGLAMAQIITQYMTKNYNRWSFAPKIYLYKSDGYSNFNWAIDDAINNGVSIILHSIVIEYGSNYDGHGFYNDLVNRATDAGIIWVNAAGNFGLTTYNGKIVVGKSGWMQLGDLDNNAFPVKCKIPKNEKVKSSDKKCNVRVVLAWDDFKNKPQFGTTKDLDLYLFDKNFESVMSSRLKQVESYKGKVQSQTLYPREMIETQIPEGTSYVKVRAMSDNFSTTDRFRITADGENISFPVRDEEESLLNPADNKNVITVGEDSSRSSISKSLNKPELIAPSLVLGDNGREYRGSSNAAAVVAAGIGLMKKINPDLDRDAILDLASQKSQGPEQILNYPLAPGNSRIMMPAPMRGYGPPPELNASFIQSNQEVQNEGDEDEDRQDYRHQGADGRAPISPYAIPTKVLQFAPLGFSCFPLADIKLTEPCVVANFIIKSHSLLVATTAGLKIATSFDPLDLIPGDTRLDIRDVVAIFPAEGFPFRRVPRNVPLPPGAIEMFKLPIDEALCKLPDWDFLAGELEISRRRIFEANQTGFVNNYIPHSCEAQALVNSRYPVSTWDMYPILQQSPYSAPVGPAPIPIGGYGQSAPPSQQGHYQDHSTDHAKTGQNFQLPNPSAIHDQ